MPENLIFPIEFDLQKAVEKAGQDWEKTYAKKLETYLAKRPVRVKLDFEKLEDVKKRLDQLKIEPITPETKTAIKELARELQVLAKALEQVQKFSKTTQLGQRNFTNDVQIEKLRQANERLEIQKRRVALAEQKHTEAMQKSATASRQLSNEYQNTSSYLKNLLTKTASLWSLHKIQSFLTGIREVTAEFELQRVSLGAIIQDQNRANQLFSEIKSFALKSPVSILNLTKYTKQLAAYKIGVDELFDTTKKLTDVSVGLGVSMDRVVLAYGQTRATGYLRASEIRQFTEMGVPIVEELASKLSKMNGELVTAAQVMDMVSKRGISFELVKEVFDDMTSAGGMFYNIQEKQGNTLFGLWAKLGDAASVMYDQIGNTDSVNNAMKAAIGLLTEFMRNWKAVGAALSIDAVGAGIYLIGKKAIQKGASIEAEKVTAATRNRAKAQAELNVQLKTGTQADIAAAQAALDKAKSDEQAAIAANKNIATIGKLKTGLLSLGKSLVTNLGIGLVISLASTLVYKIFEAWQNATRLKNTLSDIRIETGVEISRMVTNFESLAKKAVEAADGSREQKDALSELKRTYRNIIPEQNLEIDKLREMNGEYSNLTIAIREYVREQQLQKGLNTIIEDYSSKIVEETKKLKDKLGSYMFTSEDGKFFKLGENQIDRIVEEFKRLVTEGKSAQEALKGAFELESLDNAIKNYDRLADILGQINIEGTTNSTTSPTAGATYFNKIKGGVIGLTKVLQEQKNAIEKWEKQMDRTVPGLGNLTKFLDEAKKTISEYNFKNEKNTFAFDVENAKVQIDTYLKALQDALNFANVNIDLNKYITIDPKGIKHFDFKSFNEVLLDVDSEFRTRLQKLSGEVQNVYYGFIPSDRTVASLRNKLEQLSGQTGASMDVMRRYLMKDGESWADYSKRIEDEIKSYEDSLTGMKKANKAAESGKNPVLEAYSKDEINKTNTEMNTLISLMDYLKKTNIEDNSDQRLGILKEMASTLKQVNKEYEELAKKEGAIKALTDTQDKYANTFKYLQSMATKYNFELPDFGVPTDAASLAKYLDAIKEAIKKLPKSEKDVLSGETDIADINMADTQKKIEAELKRLADRISRTKTAKEFYEKILKSTGDANLALNLTTSIYGEDGQDLKSQVINQIKTALSKTKVELPAGIIDSDNNIDYKALREFAEKAKETRVIGEGAADKLIEIAENGEKELSRVAQEGAKLLLQYDEIAQKRVNIEQEASDKIRQLRDAEAVYLASQATSEEKAAYSKRTDKAVAGVEAKRDLDLLKLQDEYMRFFSAIHSLTKKEAETLRGQVRQALFKAFQDGGISADELKRELKAIDEQFQKLIEDSGMAMDYLQGGFDGLIKRVRETSDELQSVATEISKMESPEDISEGQKSFIDKILGKYGDETTGSNFSELFSKTNGDLKKMGGLLGNVSGKIGGMASGFVGALAIVDMIVKSVDSTIKGIGQIRDQFNEMRSEDNQLEGGFWDAFEYLENFNKYAVSGWEKLKSGDIIGSTFDVISSIISIFGTSQAQKVKRLNKRIEEQSELIEDLEYQYNRLQETAERTFGKDYLQSINNQVKILEAQIAAYRKQAELERKKGKGAEDKKIKEHQRSAEEATEKLRELQDDLFNRITGTDVASAARDFAQSWLDAYLSFGSTTDAIKEKFQEMVKNMLVESYLAKTVQNALMPVFDMIDERTEDGELSEKDLVDIVQKYNDTEKKLDDGLRVKMEVLKKLGFDIESLRNKDGSYTGIAKNIAGATSEEINTAAAIGNTLMYYVSPIPRMDENLSAIRALMERGISSEIPATAAASAGWTDWQKQAMDNYNAIQRNTAETVTECRRIAERCTAMASDIHKVIVPRGVKGSHGVQIYM